MDILIIILLILLNGIFSMSEIAVISARKASLKSEAKSGNKSAQKALDLSNNPNNFLSTVQVGITLIGILTGLFSGNLFAEPFSEILTNWGVSSDFSFHIAQIVIVITVTYLTIIFGELVPKRIGLNSAEKIAKAIVQPMNWLSIFAKPFVWILSKSTAFILKIIGVKETNTKITEEEIKTLIREGAKDGEVQPVEQDIVERVFSLGDRDLESIMTPRKDIVWLDVNMNKEDIRKIIAENTFSKFPLTKGELDNIEGIVYLTDIFNEIDSPDFDIRKKAQPAQFFHENMEVYSALEEMKKTHNHVALIMDEFGALQGIVTLKDIMEAIVGEIPSGDEEPQIITRQDGSYLIDGQCPFYDFLDYFEMNDLYATNDYNTLGGLILEELGHIPKAGEYFNWHHLKIEVADMDGVRIDKVIVKQLSENG